MSGKIIQGSSSRKINANNEIHLAKTLRILREKNISQYDFLFVSCKYIHKLCLDDEKTALVFN